MLKFFVLISIFLVSNYSLAESFDDMTESAEPEAHVKAFENKVRTPEVNTGAIPNQFSIGFELGVSTLQLSGEGINIITSQGDFQQNAVSGVNVEIPMSEKVRFLTGLRSEKLEWKYSSGATGYFDAEFINIPIAFRFYITQTRVAPYLDLGLVLSDMVDSSVGAPKFESFNFRAQAAIGAKVNIIDEVAIKLGARGQSSLTDEIESIEGSQRITSFGGYTEFSYQF